MGWEAQSIQQDEVLMLHETTRCQLRKIAFIQSMTDEFTKLCKNFQCQ